MSPERWSTCARSGTPSPGTRLLCPGAPTEFWSTATAVRRTCAPVLAVAMALASIAAAISASCTTSRRAPGCRPGAHLRRERPVVGVRHAVNHLAKPLRPDGGEHTLEVGHQRRQPLGPRCLLLRPQHVPARGGGGRAEHSHALRPRGGRLQHGEQRFGGLGGGGGGGRGARRLPRARRGVGPSLGRRETGRHRRRVRGRVRRRRRHRLHRPAPRRCTGARRARSDVPADGLRADGGPSRWERGSRPDGRRPDGAAHGSVEPTADAAETTPEATPLPKAPRPPPRPPPKPPAAPPRQRDGMVGEPSLVAQLHVTARETWAAGCSAPPASPRATPRTRRRRSPRTDRASGAAAPDAAARSTRSGAREHRGERLRQRSDPASPRWRVKRTRSASLWRSFVRIRV